MKGHAAISASKTPEQTPDEAAAAAMSDEEKEREARLQDYSCVDVYVNVFFCILQKRNK